MHLVSLLLTAWGCQQPHTQWGSCITEDACCALTAGQHATDLSINLALLPSEISFMSPTTTQQGYARSLCWHAWAMLMACLACLLINSLLNYSHAVLMRSYHTLNGLP